MQETVVDIQRWVSLVLVSLRVILTKSKEEVVLGRLQQLGLTISLSDVTDGVDTECTHEPAAAESSNPDRMFAKYVFRCCFVDLSYYYTAWIIQGRYLGMILKRV